MLQFDSMQVNSEMEKFLLYYSLIQKSTSVEELN